MKANAVYLGDGAYAELDDTGGVRIFTSNGVTEENEIFLELPMVGILNRYIEREVTK